MRIRLLIALLPMLAFAAPALADAAEERALARGPVIWTGC